jgi:hypothetical protein
MKRLSRFNRDRQDPRNARRQRLALRLHEAGPRPTFEAILDIAAGHDLDETLEDFARLDASTYEAVGANRLPIQKISIVKGGKR